MLYNGAAIFYQDCEKNRKRYMDKTTNRWKRIGGKKNQTRLIPEIIH